METSKEKEEAWNIAPTPRSVTIKERNIHRVKTVEFLRLQQETLLSQYSFFITVLSKFFSEERELLNGFWSLWTFLLTSAVAPFIQRRFSVVHFQVLSLLNYHYCLEVNRKQIFHYSPSCMWLDILFFKCLFVMKVLNNFLQSFWIHLKLQSIVNVM